MLTGKASAPAQAGSVYERQRMPPDPTAGALDTLTQVQAPELEHLSETVLPLWKIFPETFGVDGWD